MQEASAVKSPDMEEAAVAAGFGVGKERSLVGCHAFGLRGKTDTAAGYIVPVGVVRRGCRRGVFG